MNKRKLTALLLACIMTLSLLIGCSESIDKANIEETYKDTSLSVVKRNPSLKYVFLFIGDGMSYPQFQAASYYLGAMDETDDILSGGENLAFMEFPVAGSATTFDSTSFCPDSASTATSISTGKKTYSGVINMDETKTKPYETIAEKLKAQKGFKIGVISSVNLNHATPAAFYAHQASRNNYYEIGLEMIESGFDYFAGGGLKKVNGANGDKESLYSLAKKAGYTVAMTQSDASNLKTGGKAIVIGETLADSEALSYENDRANGEWSLSDYVAKGIEVIDNDKGFFMMVEGGKIDWACHANDAGSTIADTIAMDDAVKEAAAFAEKHPKETLILVTGDHETGGLTIGYAGTDYNTYLSNLALQKISYAKYDSDYVSGYIKNKTSFEDVMKDVTALFGLTTPENAASAASKTLVMNDYEMGLLKAAYDLTMAGGIDNPTQEEYILYGTYEPLSVTITHLLNNKSGINFSSYAHTGLPVAVFASGQGQDAFGGFYDNTDIYYNLASLLGVK